MKKGDKNIDITYRLIRNNEEWLLFDILIEGISILKSLQSQYSDMVRKYGIHYTIDKLKSNNKYK